MINTCLEITENEYLIKLNRSKFNLSFIRSLLKIVEVSDQSEDDAIYDKTFGDNSASSNSADYYSHLDEK
jgi:hypothetical protein